MTTRRGVNIVRRRTGLRVAVVVAGVVVGFLGLAGPATGRRAGSCDARPGSTLVENAVARVYVAHGADFACSRASGRTYRMSVTLCPQVCYLVRDKRGGCHTVAHVLRHEQLCATGSSPPRDIQLAGQFVAWRQLDLGGDAVVLVIDVVRGTFRQALSVGSPHNSSAAYVMNSHGTVVWIHGYSALGTATDWVNYSTQQGTSSTLEETTNHVAPGNGGAPSPISSLGLSNTGDFAYWNTNGQLRGAKIP